MSNYQESERSHRLLADDVHEIFAWLDYCVAKRLGRKKFETTVVRYLRNTRQKDFSLEQIDAKLLSLCGISYGDRIKALYDEGTKSPDFSFPGFSDTVRAKIQARVKQLVKNPISVHLKSRSRKKKPSIRTGNAAQTSQLRRSSRAATTPCTALSEAQETAKRPRGKQPSYLTTSAIADSEDPEDPLSSTLSSIGSDYDDLHPLKMRTQPEVVIHRSKTFKEPPEKPILSTEPILGCYSKGSTTQSQVLNNRERDMQNMRIKLLEARKTIEELRRELLCKEQAYATLRKLGTGSVEEILESRLNRIEILESQIADKRTLRPFTTRIKEKHIPLDQRYFEKNMQSLKNNIDEFMATTQTTLPGSELETARFSAELGRLFQRILGKSMVKLGTISLQSLLRSLLSAAVCEWVLEADFQEQCLDTTPLREAMLSHLATQDGEDVARNLDFAAHYTIIESEDFQHYLIPDRASSFASSFISLITSFAEMEKLLGSWDTEMLQDLEAHQRTLAVVFTAALKIKTKAIVSKEVFKCIFPSRGELYNMGYMVDAEACAGRTVIEGSPHVQLCVVPGLKACPSERKLVSHNNFEIQDSIPDDAWVCLAKSAVVLDG